MPNAGEQLNSEIAALVKQDAEHGESLGVLTDQLVLTNRRVAALEQRVAALESAPPPVTEPPPVPPVNPGEPIPVLIRKVAPDKPDRGDGLRVPAGTANVNNTHIEGFEQNIVAEAPGLNVTWTNVRAVKALRQDNAGQNVGQGFYLGEGKHKLTSCAAVGNGWRKQQTGREYRNDRCHGIYANVGTDLETTDFISVENGYAGMQCRGKSRHIRPILIGNGCGFAGIYGPHELIDPIFLDPQLYGGTNNSGRYWEGAFGVYGWGPIKLTNPLFVCQSPPIAPYTPLYTPDATKLPIYLGGMVKLDRKHSQYPDTPGGTIEVVNGTAAGWPGPVLAGDNVGASPAPVYAMKMVKTLFDWRPVVTALVANEISHAEACRRLRDGAHGTVA